MNESGAKKVIKEMREMIRRRHLLEENVAPAQAGINFFIKNEFEKAASAFGLAIKLAPENFFSHYYLGRSCRRLGKYQEASRCFTKALELNSLHAPSYAYLGDAFLRDNNLVEAGRYFRRALELQFDNLAALRGLVRLVKIGNEDRREIAELLRKAYVQGKQNSIILMELFSIIPPEPEFCLQLADGFAVSRSYARAAFFYRLALMRSQENAEMQLKISDRIRALSRSQDPGKTAEERATFSHLKSGGSK